MEPGLTRKDIEAKLETLRHQKIIQKIKEDKLKGGEKQNGKTNIKD